MHDPDKMFIPAAIQRRLEQIPTSSRHGLAILENFGMFVDTHRDQPHVGSFTPDIHRGACRPMMVDYLVVDDQLWDNESGRVLQRHDKHMFVDPDWFGEFLVHELLTNGTDPRDGDGIMPTAHLRDPRAKKYHLRSFRQVVVDLYEKEMAARKKVRTT